MTSQVDLFRAVRTSDLRTLQSASDAALVQALDPTGRSLIVEAASRDSPDLIHLLAERGVDLEHGDQYGQRAVHVAASRGALTALQALAQLGAAVDAEYNYGLNAVHAAVEHGHVHVLDYLIECGVDVHALGADGFSTAHAASEGGRVPLLTRLVEHGVDVRRADVNGLTTLHAAAFKGHVDMIEHLVQLHVDVAAAMVDGRTVLHAAAFNGHVPALRKLVELGADPACVAESGKTPLHSAAQNGHAPVVKELIDLGVKLDALDDGKTALDLAAEDNHVDVAAVLLEAGAAISPSAASKLVAWVASQGLVEDLDRLVELGVRVESLEQGGACALIAAAENGEEDAISRLVDLGVSPSVKTTKGESAVRVAVKEVQMDTAILLLGLGAEDTQHDAGDILSWAAANGQTQAIDGLAFAGIDIKQEFAGGQTAVHIAAKNGHTDTIERLIELGLDPDPQPHIRALMATKSLRSAPVHIRPIALALENNHFEAAACLLSHLPVAGLELDAGLPAPLQRCAVVGGHKPHLISVAELAGLDAQVTFLMVTSNAVSTAEDSELLRQAWPRLQRVTRLTLSHITLTADDLDAIAALPLLRELYLADCQNVDIEQMFGGCEALQVLHMQRCGIAALPVALASLPQLQQLHVADNPFVASLDEYGIVFKDPFAAVEYLRQAQDSTSKSTDVPAVLVGHGRAGKTSLIRGLLHQRSWLPIVDRVPRVAGRTTAVLSTEDMELAASGSSDATLRVHFFDTPGQMEYFASNMAVIAPLFASSTVIVVVRARSHGSGPQVDVAAEKRRVRHEFTLWLSEVSRVLVGLELSKRALSADHSGDDDGDEPLHRQASLIMAEGVDVQKRARVILVLTHRDALPEDVSETIDSWLPSLTDELGRQFGHLLALQGKVDFVDATVAGKRGHGVYHVRRSLKDLTRDVFSKRPGLPALLVEARDYVLSDAIRKTRIMQRAELLKALLDVFPSLSSRLLSVLLEVLEANGSVLRTPGQHLVVVDAAWISSVISSLYPDPNRLDATAGVDVGPDALEQYDAGGEIMAAGLVQHLTELCDGDAALMDKLKAVLVSSGIVIPLRVSISKATQRRKVESYMIVGRWMNAEHGDDGSVKWTSSRPGEAGWFELVTGRPYSVEQAVKSFGLMSEAQPSYDLVSLVCKCDTPLGPSFLTRSVHRLATSFASTKHAFAVRRSGFACVFPFTRFHGAVCVSLPGEGDTFELTLITARRHSSAALTFVLAECVFPVLRSLALHSSGHRFRAWQRCSACVATHADLSANQVHTHELMDGALVGDSLEEIEALCVEALTADPSGHNWQYEYCRGCDGIISTLPDNLSDELAATYAAAFVPAIDRSAIEVPESAEVLGAGQFGSVLKGAYNGADVVLKELKAWTPEAEAELRAEAELLGRVSRHPCVSMLLGLCQLSERQMYMVMEYAGTCNLEEALCESPQKPLLGGDPREFGVILSLLKDSAAALTHMHAQDPPIVHNDVALRNVMVRSVNGRNRAKLTDLGLGRVVPRGTVGRFAKGLAVPVWQMAPESLQSREFSPASDVYQFGNLMWEALARRRPFAGEFDSKTGWRGVAQRVVQGERPPHDLVVGHCTDSLWELVQECWSADPSERPSMADVSTALGQELRRLGGVPENQEPIRANVARVEEDEEVEEGVYEGYASYQYAAEEAYADGVEALAEDEEEDEDDDDGDEEKDEEEEEEGDSVQSWSVDDVCSWLEQLPVPACAALVPMFREAGINGEILLTLGSEQVRELGLGVLAAHSFLHHLSALRNE